MPGRLFRFDGASFSRVVDEQISKSQNNQIVIGTDNKHWIRKFSHVSRWDADAGVMTWIYSRKPPEEISSMAIESDSRVWVGTSSGLVRLDAPDDPDSTEL